MSVCVRGEIKIRRSNAPTGLYSALATEYSKIVKEFPIEIQVFPDLDAAEEWISE
jgi:hypothetical protein